MQHTLKMPAYDDLADLSNAELTRRIKMAKYELDGAQQRGESTGEKARIYHVFEHERVRRLKLTEAITR